MRAEAPAGLMDAFWGYERALMSNDVEALDRLFAPGPDTLLVVPADPPRRRRAETTRGDGDAFAPGPGPSLAETPLNCSSIDGVTGNMPGVELFYERASRRVERSQKTTRLASLLSSFTRLLFF